MVGWSSQTIQRILRCLLTHTFLRTQIRNVPRRCHQNEGSRVFVLTIPKRPKLQSIQSRTKITRAPCRRRTGEAVLRAGEFGDLITADHKVLNEKGESRNIQRIRCRGTRSCNSMNSSILSVQNKNFSPDGNDFKKVSRASEKPKVVQIISILSDLANPVKIYHGIIVLQHTIDPRRVA